MADAKTTLLEQTPGALTTLEHRNDLNRVVRALARELGVDYATALDRFNRSTMVGREFPRAEPESVGDVVRRCGVKTLDSFMPHEVFEEAGPAPDQAIEGAREQLPDSGIRTLDRMDSPIRPPTFIELDGEQMMAALDVYDKHKKAMSLDEAAAEVSGFRKQGPGIPAVNRPHLSGIGDWADRGQLHEAVTKYQAEHCCDYLAALQAITGAGPVLNR